jgi:D-psicose/D-tagatose/L-ribulose 3-epimerase
MRYGINLLLWTDDVFGEDVAPLLRSIREAGYDGVEIPIFQPDVEGSRRLARLVSEAGLECTVLTVRTEADDPISPDAAVRKRGVELTKQVLDCCEVLGAELLSGPFHSALGYFSGKSATAEQRKYGVEAMREVAEYARTKNIPLAIEYLNRFECYFLNSAADMVSFIDEVNHPACKMMYDTFHAHIEEKSVADAIATAGDRLVHVHVSENDRSTPGVGQIAWEETFDALAKVRYEGWLMIEAFGTRLPNLAAATKIWRRMFDTEEQLMREALAFTKREWGKRELAVSRR